MNLASFATNVAKPARAADTKELTQDIVQFIRDLATQGVRMSYGAFSAILKENGVINQRAPQSESYVLLDEVPLDSQWVICRENGYYARSVYGLVIKPAKRNGESVTIETIKEMPVIDAKSGVEAFRAWKLNWLQQVPPTQKAAPSTGGPAPEVHLATASA